MWKNHCKLYCQTATAWPVAKRALSVAIVIGSLLNIINQGEALIHLDIAGVDFVKFFLTYLVPYGVASYTAVALKLEFHLGTKSIANADLECRICKKKIHVKEHEVIPECGECGLKTRWKLV